jgi:hypothetical protein
VQRWAVRDRKEKSLSPEEKNLIFVGTDPVYRLYTKLKTNLIDFPKHV